MHHSKFLYVLARIYKPKNYLELGLYAGETFNLIEPLVQKAVGVDISPPQNLKGEIHKCTTDDFFKTNTTSFDLIFIDADHQYESSKKDFLNSIKFLNSQGLVVMHDTDPTTNELFSKNRCGDSYKIVNDLEQNTDYNIFTLPIAEAGLSIITKKNDTRTHNRNS
tara:strand:- start:2190 stop:2684 length:495 start_codon:yes stop_codon:yes gene_type:complete